jgi:hypothetical protein
MIQGRRNRNSKGILIKILTCLTLLVWLSSFTQLSFFKQIHESKTMLMIAGALGAGIASDIISVSLFTLPGLWSGKTSSPLTLSGIFYLVSSIVYGKPFLSFMIANSAFLQSLVKVIEFWILIAFHGLCTILIPNLVDNYIEHRNRIRTGRR